MAPLIQALASLGMQWLNNKREKAAAAAEREVQLIKGAQSWDEIHANNSGSSWKDEWFTTLLSIPLIFAFFPETIHYIDRGFAVLEGMPDWYKAMLFLAVGASFGYRGIMDYLDRKKGA